MNADEIVKELRESCTGNEFAPPMVTNRELTEAADLIGSLQAQLAASQRREKAAVEDLKLHGGCASCAYRIGSPPHSPCKKFAMDKQSAYIRCLAYDWRGLAEKGESHD